MKLLQRIAHWYNELTRSPSLDEIMASEASEAELLERQCRTVILNHEYQRHMARAKLEAINVWRRHGPVGPD